MRVGRSLKEKVQCYLNICQRILETVRNFVVYLSIQLFKSFFSAVPLLYTV